MKCEECSYYTINQKIKTCEITHVCNPLSCGLQDDKTVKDMQICFNCKNWIGGGDYGLSCKNDYYMANSNGFQPACKNYDPK